MRMITIQISKIPVPGGHELLQCSFTELLQKRIQVSTRNSAQNIFRPRPWTKVDLLHQFQAVLLENGKPSKRVHHMLAKLILGQDHVGLHGHVQHARPDIPQQKPRVTNPRNLITGRPTTRLISVDEPAEIMDLGSDRGTTVGRVCTSRFRFLVAHTGRAQLPLCLDRRSNPRGSQANPSPGRRLQWCRRRSRDGCTSGRPRGEIRSRGRLGLLSGQHCMHRGRMRHGNSSSSSSRCSCRGGWRAAMSKILLDPLKTIHHPMKSVVKKLIHLD